MPRVVAFDDVRSKQVKRKISPEIPAGLSTTFIGAQAGAARTVHATHSTYDPGSISNAHFHTVDQFQVVIEGKGRFGRHDAAPYLVHFSRAYTPYGPLRADESTGWTFLTFRTRYDPGAQRMPASKEKLMSVPDRHPWQITASIDFSAHATGALQYLPGINDANGLFGCSLKAEPDTRTTAPPASHGDGQYVVILDGSLMHDGAERRALTVVYVAPEESAFTIHAGPRGLCALIFNFPDAGRSADVLSQPTSADTRKWQCMLCSFAYDEAAGIPAEGIAPGTRWEDVSETWTCPDCGAAKADFVGGRH